MSIEDLCKGDVVVKQSQSLAAGATMGVEETYTDGSSYDCNIQVEDRGDPDGAFQDNRYGARGQRTLYKVYFSQDVTLLPSNRLKWTIKRSTTLSTPQLLRVIDYYEEGRPGEDMLWIADCEHVDTRMIS